jgi:hypothetical protein
MMKKNLLLLALLFLASVIYVNAQKSSQSEILWNNTHSDMSDNGFQSCYWSGNDNWYLAADDFEADGAWVIEKIYSKGTPYGVSEIPTQFAVIIYENGTGDKPGNEIYRNNAIPVADGLNPEITLPTPFTLPGAGTYWISIAGVYDVSVFGMFDFDANRWNIWSSSTNVGFFAQANTKTGLFFNPANTWFPAPNILGSVANSMYFQIEGSREEEEIPPVSATEFTPEDESVWSPFFGPAIHEYVSVAFSGSIAESSLAGITINGAAPLNVEVNQYSTNTLLIYGYYDWGTDFEIIIPAASIKGLQSDIVYTFSTPPALAIATLLPDENATVVALDAEVSVTFTKNIFTNAMLPPTVTITKTGGENVGGVSYDPINPIPGNNKLVINHDDFEYDTEYTVTIPPYTVMEWTEPIIWTFTTENNPNVSDCDSPTNFVVEYTEDCKANLSWDASAKTRSTILWDNTIGDMENIGLSACYWSENNNWYVSADDFVADDAWVIEKIYAKGAPSGVSPMPTKFSVVIYENGTGNIPGTEIYRNNAIPVTNGLNPEITLPTPFTLPEAGTFWISIAAAYDVSVTNLAGWDENRWIIYSSSASIGHNTHLYSTIPIYFNPISTWFPGIDILGENAKSMYFKIEGTGGGTTSTTKYNVYRDDLLIAGNITTTSYTDNNLVATTGHTWKVTTVCEDGESAPASVTKDACDDTPPLLTVTEFIPSNGSVWLSFISPEINDYVRVTFSESIEGSSLAGITINGNAPISVTNPQPKLLMIYGYFDWDTDFEIIIPAAAINGLTDNIIYTFSTPPTLAVTTLLPAANATNVALNAEVSVTFTKNIFTMVYPAEVTISKTGGGNVGGVSIIPITPYPGSNILTINHNDFESGAEYTVTIPDGVIGGWTEPITWKFTTGTSNIKENKNANLFVYPNPTTGELRIENGELRIGNVEIYDVYGRKVSNLISHISNQKIDISHLESGIYFLKINETKVKIVKL